METRYNLNLSPLAISYFVHLIATVVWLGGLALMVLIVYPLQKREGDWQPIVDAISQRFRPFANFCLLVLLMTGIVQTGEDVHYGGLLDFSEPWSQAMLGKHIAYAAMVAIVVWLQFGLAPAMERARLLAKKDITSLTNLRQRQKQLTQANFALSLVVLFFTAIATAI